MDIEEQRQFQHCLGSFLTLEGETLLFAKRKHVRTLIAPIVTSILLFFIFSAAAFFLITTFFSSHILIFFAVSLVLLSVTTSIIAKLVVDWIFHLYIITNRKVIEVCNKPFFSKDIYVVSLDQVRCVEINAKEQGMFKALVGIGDVVCHFDMLTHQDEFIMSSIASPEKVGVLVGDVLNSIIAKRSSSSVTPLPMQQDNINPNAPISQPIYQQKYSLRVRGGAV